ncbi:hypothetical protein L484_012922 [Morus notabilis]|uniref:Uncharacterized protein n=1 Tax=Morus notabilis TaxID=981085 RepID=W9QZ18_9ROSA|nr:hypothetical protein L484_012922 [Morus notabilis]
MAGTGALPSEEGCDQVGFCTGSGRASQWSRLQQGLNLRLGGSTMKTHCEGILSTLTPIAADL